MKNLPTFKDKKLLKLAFTHRSYLNESKEAVESNERLEFLGDSILSYVMSDYLFKTYPDYKEGVLTNLRSLLVNTKSLAEVARELEFGKNLLLSRGEEESKGRENETILANSLEAYLGALYLDQGITAIRSFLEKTLIPKAEVHVKNKSFKDPKSLLQEMVQARKQHSPIYKVLEEEGPPHLKTFTVGVHVSDDLIAKGKGPSKQKAEEDAAKHALEKLGK
jgi:ribonuclease-3